MGYVGAHIAVSTGQGLSILPRRAEDPACTVDISLLGRWHAGIQVGWAHSTALASNWSIASRLVTC